MRRRRRRHRRRRRRIDASRAQRRCPKTEELARVLPLIEALARRRRAGIGRHDEARRHARGDRRRRRDDQRRARAAGAAARSRPWRDATSRVCLMHMQGEPRTMQQAPAYDDVVREVRDFPRASARGRARRPASRATASSSIRALASARRWSIISRCCARCRDRGARLSGPRRAVAQVDDRRAHRARRSTSGCRRALPRRLLAVARGASIVRVHDVRETVDALKVWHAVAAT